MLVFDLFEPKQDLDDWTLNVLERFPGLVGNLKVALDLASDLGSNLFELG
jgi:hypothetical protein